MLDRDTLWRQGSIFRTSDAQAIGLIGSEEGFVAIVVTHDCDIPNSKESDVEVIVGKICKKDKMLANAKNPRRLHIVYQNNGTDVVIDLLQIDKQYVEKARFEEIGQPDDSFSLSDEQKRALKQWLASRYGRPAYPNSFENRLTSRDTSKSRLEKEIANILIERSEHIIALFFDLDEYRNVELPEEEPYILRIVVAYDAVEGGSEARRSAEDAAAEISRLFHARFGEPENATAILLETCTALADTQISLSDIRKLDQWRLEYVSIQDEPQTPYLASGN